MRGTMHPLVHDYLERLRSAAQSLPAHDRDELLAELQSHLDSAVPDGATDADVRNALAELGRPEDIVAAANPDPPGDLGVTGDDAAPAQSPWGPMEVIPVLCLTLGAFVAPVVGPVTGLVLAWSSSSWSRREKWLATMWVLVAVLVVLVFLLVSFGSSGI